MSGILVFPPSIVAPIVLIGFSQSEYVISEGIQSPLGVDHLICFDITVISDFPGRVSSLVPIAVTTGIQGTAMPSKKINTFFFVPGKLIWPYTVISLSYKHNEMK